MVAMMRKYRIDVQRGQRWWVLSVPEIKAAHSQARHLREVDEVARDLIAVMLEVEPDSFDLDVHIELPESVQKHLRRATELREQAARAQADAARESRAAAKELADAGLPLRDIGIALGVSFQRAQQLVAA